ILNDSNITIGTEGYGKFHALNEHKCNFLFVYDYPVSEGLAIQHMQSFIQLAQALDRIFVLPNIFLNNNTKVMFITQQEFYEWTRSLDFALTTHHAYIEEDDSNSFVEAINPLEKTRENFTRILIDKLNIETQLILMSYNTRETFSSNVIPYSIYSQDILLEANTIVDKLKPFVAIHLNVEFTDQNRLNPCTKLIIETLMNFGRDFGIQNIYFTTNKPLFNGSFIFDVLIEYQSEMMETLTQPMSFNTWNSMNSFNIKDFEKLGIRSFENSDYVMDINGFEIFDHIADVKEFEGTGIHEILDKLVSINAEYFLADLAECSSVTDSFKSQVIKTREIMINKGNKKLKKRYF
ncbi:22129_t:CDS:2, partial [Dentiscutata erythropus]